MFYIRQQYTTQTQTKNENENLEPLSNTFKSFITPKLSITSISFIKLLLNTFIASTTTILFIDFYACYDEFIKSI